MLHLDRVNRKYYRDMYRIAISEEPFQSDMTLEQFVLTMNSRDGWVVKDNDEVVGSITLHDFMPKTSVSIHCVILKPYRSKWMRKTMLKTVFGYIFDRLGMNKVKSFAVPHITDGAGYFLERLGFKSEGNLRQEILIAGTYHDVVPYGMLKEDCRWV